MLVFEKVSIGRKVFFLTIYGFLNLTLFTSNSLSTELGVTSNHIYRIWQNIDFATEALFHEIHGSPLSKAVTVKPRRFMGKTSNDVMDKALNLHRDLALIIDIQLTQTEPYWVQEYDGFERNILNREDMKTESDVYVFSSHILHSIVNKYVEITNGTKSIRHFYPEDILLPNDKTLDDVYAELDLLSAKLEYVSSNSLSIASGE